QVRAGELHDLVDGHLAHDPGPLGSVDQTSDHGREVRRLTAGLRVALDGDLGDVGHQVTGGAARAAHVHHARGEGRGLRAGVDLRRGVGGAVRELDLQVQAHDVL